MSQLTPAGSSGAPSTAVVTGASNPTVQNISLDTATIEYSYALPLGTKHFLIKLRNASAKLQLAYTSGMSGVTYVTIHPGTFFSTGDLTTDNTILYFQSGTDSQTAEIVSWV